LKALCREVENSCGFAMRTPRDFNALSELIQARTGATVSTTTLKRAWGYLTRTSGVSSYTLNSLAQLVGYRDLDAYREHSDALQSNLLLSDKLSASEVPTGGRVRLTWRPNRVCVVEHLGDNRFRVIESQNSKLAVGDTFVCQMFIRHEPLYVDDLEHGGEATHTAYVAGRTDGILFELLPSIE